MIVVVKIPFKFSKKSKTALFFSIFLISIFFFRNPISKSINIPLVRSGGTYVPSGLIGLWNGSLIEIPSGWALCDGSVGTPNTTDKFVYNTDGVEDPGSTGGSDSHSHNYNAIPTHDHGFTSTASLSHTHQYGRPTQGVGASTGGVGPMIRYGSMTGTNTVSQSHGHSISSTGTGSCETDETEDILPPYYSLAYIKKLNNDPTIPIGLIVMWSGDIEDIPSGWEYCNGSNGTPDLREKFILGVELEDPGDTGGSETHTHDYSDVYSHSHGMESRGYSHSHGVYAYPAGVAPNVWPLTPVTVGAASIQNTGGHDQAHSHSISLAGQPTCTTQSSSHVPPYSTVAYIMNTEVTIGLPMGVISYWSAAISSIPIGWDQCDGTDGTLDLRNRFARGSSVGEPIGTLGGSATHTHIYTDVPSHTHSVATGTMYHYHQFYYGGSSYGALTGSTGFARPGGSSYPTTSASFSHSHDVYPAGTSNPSTLDENNLPPYIELTLIQQLIPVTSIAWVSPDMDDTILFARTATVPFDFEYAWSGHGNNITLSLSNGTDSFNTGNVMGLTQATINYLAGDITAVFHLWQDNTELTNATRSFTFINNREPSVSLEDPDDGETISGNYTISWTGDDPDGDTLHYTLSYNVNDTAWVELIGDTTSTTFEWDTKALPNSEDVVLKVQVTDGYGGESVYETGEFTIYNEGPPRIPGYNVAILISLLMIASILFGLKNRKK